MKILYVTNMYPDEKNPYYGIFVKEQIDTIQNNYGDILETSIFFINGKVSKVNYLKSIFRIPRMIRKFKPDLIHIHYGLSGLFLLFGFLFRLPPTLVTLHGGDINKNRKENWLIRRITYLIIRRAKKIIILNELMKLQLRKYKSKLVQIPCGVNTKLFKPLLSTTHSIASNKCPRNIYKIGFPGDKSRIVKNYKLFNNILSELQQNGYDTKEVEFINMTREEVNLSLNNIDILLMTSTSEGSPQIIKEAMSCNVPIVSTKVGDVQYLLKDIANCFVIDSLQAEAFIPVIENILKEKKSNRVTTGRQKLIDLRLDADSIASCIFHQYQLLLKEQ